MTARWAPTSRCAIPRPDDFWGKEGCNELLVLSRPDIIKDIHAAFFKVGCDVVETNTFGGTRIVLAEYELRRQGRGDQYRRGEAGERSRAAIFHARQAPLRRRIASGPTTKLPSLGHISFDDMAAAFEEQASALIEGGVDVLLIETSQDLLQAKVALARRVRRDAESRQAPARHRAGHAARATGRCCWAPRSAPR